MKEVQNFHRDFGVLDDVDSSPGSVPLSLMQFVKKWHVWDWGSEQPAPFAKAEIPVRQRRALSISQARLPFKVDVSVTPGGTG